MPTINYAGNSYAGEVLEDLLVYTAQGNDTFREGLIHIKPGIQHKLSLPHVGLGKIIQDNVATPNSTQGGANAGFNEYTFSERYLEPQDFMVYLEFNPRDFEDYWKPFQPNNQLIFRDLDPKVQATMLHLLVDRKDEYIGDCIWASRKGGTNSGISSDSASNTTIGGDSAAGPMKYFDGFVMRMLKNIEANGNVANANKPGTIASGVSLYDGTGAPVSAAAIVAGGTYYTDSSHSTLAVKGTDYTEPTGPASSSDINEAATGNVILAGNTAMSTGAQVEAALYAMYQKCPKKLRKSNQLCFVMGWELWDLYDQYLSNKDEKYTENANVNTFRFKGKRVVVINGITEQTIVLGKFSSGIDSCLWMGVDYATDQESVKIEKLQANSELYFFQMRMKVDTNIVLPSEIVVWTTYKYVGGAGVPAL